MGADAADHQHGDTRVGEPAGQLLAQGVLLRRDVQTDPRLCAAIVDRPTFNGTIIETGTDSYRLASTRAKANESANAC